MTAPDNFVPRIPRDGSWVLVAGDERCDRLLYCDARGKEWLVPNIWYNQPVPWRIAAARRHANQNEIAIARLDETLRTRAGMDWDSRRELERRIERFRKRATQLRQAADEMERTRQRRG